MSFQLTAIITLGLFYALFLVVGVVVSRTGRARGIDELLLASRQLPLAVGACTMVATWVGGGYLNGTAEAVYDSGRGLVWAQAPWGYALSLVLGGLFFAGRMRRLGFRTLLDLFERRYGKRVAAGLFVPALMGEVFWSAAILAALGTTLGTILGFDFRLSILVSAGVAIGYTLVGGLKSVAYTDLLQLFLILFGLGIAIPAAVGHVGGIEDVMGQYVAQYGSAASLVPPADSWSLNGGWGWLWGDWALLLIFGGIPWQVYFQRVLACKDERSAVRLSIIAGAGCLLLAIPAGILGAVGGVVDWSAAGVQPPEHPALILPWVLRYLTPSLIAILGLSAIAAAVMSSVDSSILSAASMFTWNVVRPFRKRENKRLLQNVLRFSVVCVGALASVLALHVGSVYTLWALCGDVVYVLLFPQLVLALFDRKANSTGAIAGVCVGLFLRAGGGESSLGIPALLPYPMNDPELGLLFPFRTCAMLASLLTIWLVSRLTAEKDPPQPIELVEEN